MNSVHCGCSHLNNDMQNLDSRQVPVNGELLREAESIRAMASVSVTTAHIVLGYGLEVSLLHLSVTLSDSGCPACGDQAENTS